MAASIEKKVEPVRALTAVRGLAAWWVVAYHFREALPSETPPLISHFIDKGFLAVDLFFILSGYVIAINYSVWFATKWPWSRLRRFLVLRLARIYPLHAFMLALFVANPLAAWLFSTQGSPGELRPLYYIASIFLVQSWGLFGLPGWNVPAWSISTEWLAYISFPVLVRLALPITSTIVRTICYTMCSLLVLIMAVRLAGRANLNNADPLFGVIRCLVEFGIGFGVARADQFGRSAAVTRFALLGAITCFAACAVFAIADYEVLPAGFALMIYALADETAWVSVVLRSHILQWLGTISYSTYLSHYFVKIWTKFTLDRSIIPHAALFPAYTFFVVVASALLYTYVERPGQQWSRRRLAGSRNLQDDVQNVVRKGIP